MDGTRVRCAKTCDDDAEVVQEGCGQCPEGLVNIDDPANVPTACVELCDGAERAFVCAPEQFCPTGTFDSRACALGCEPVFVCLKQCGDEVWDVSCKPCEPRGFVDQRTCLDAGVDGG